MDPHGPGGSWKIVNSALFGAARSGFGFRMLYSAPSLPRVKDLFRIRYLITTHGVTMHQWKQELPVRKKNASPGHDFVVGFLVSVILVFMLPIPISGCYS
jgi:hypothetical protein